MPLKFMGITYLDLCGKRYATASAKHSASCPSYSAARPIA